MMRNSAMTARPAARKATQSTALPTTGPRGPSGATSRAKKTQVVNAVARKSEPIIAMVERRSSLNLREVQKKTGELPTPSMSMTF
jgi:hypothetical protein